MPTVLDAWPALLLLAAIIASPWLVTWVRRSGLHGQKPGDQTLKVLCTVAVGPQQRVVSLEVLNGAQRTCLVLGVTAHTITRLDAIPLGIDAQQRIDTSQHAAPPFNDVLRQQTETLP